MSIPCVNNDKFLKTLRYNCDTAICVPIYYTKLRYPSMSVTHQLNLVMMSTKIILRFLATKCTMIYIYWTVKVLPNHWALCIHGEHSYRFNQPYFLDRKLSRKGFCQGTEGVAQSAQRLTSTGRHLQHRVNQTWEARVVERIVRRSWSLLALWQAQGQHGLLKNLASQGIKSILFWSWI